MLKQNSDQSWSILINYGQLIYAIKVNLQTRAVNGLSELGEKIFLDRYAVKDVKRETLAVGDTVVVLVNPKTGQREIGTIENVNHETREVSVRMRGGEVNIAPLSTWTSLWS